MAEWIGNCGIRKCNRFWHSFLFLSIVSLCVTPLQGAPICRGTDACNVDDSLSWLSDVRLWNPGDKGSQISRSVLNAWCNGTVQDAVKHALEFEADVVASKKGKLTCLQTMAEKEEEWMEEQSQLRLQFLGEKRELQRACVEKDLLLRVKLGAERETLAADLAACRALQRSMIGVEECNYQKHLVLSKCEADRDSFATKLGLQKELVDRRPGENAQLGSCEDSVIQQQTRMRWLQESLGNCRMVIGLKELKPML